jgi:O-antigen/teichoic acid export membrane protein
MAAARALARTGTIVLLGQVAVAVIGVVQVRAFTELVPPSVFGEASLILGILALGLQLFVAPFTSTQLRYHSGAGNAAEATAFTREALLWSLRSTLVLAGLLGIAYGIAAAAGATVPGLVVLPVAVLWLLANACRNVLMGRIHADQRQALYVGMQVIEAALLGVLTFALLALHSHPAMYVLGQALAIAVLVVALKEVWPVKAESDAEFPGGRSTFLRSTLDYGLPFIPMSLLNWVATLADRYILAYIAGAASAGLYVAPSSVGSKGMAMGNAALNDLFRPSLFTAANQQRRADLDRTIRTWLALSVLFGLVSVLVIWIVGQFLVQLLLAEMYRSSAAAIMLWTTAAYAMLGIVQVFETSVLSLGKSVQLVGPMAIGVLASVAACAVLVPLHGAVGAAQGMCTGFAARSIAIGLVLQRTRARKSWIDWSN